jgi:hypothetical protein
LKLALKYRPDTVVVNVPFLLGENGHGPVTAESLGLRRDDQEHSPVERYEPSVEPG